MKSQWKLTFETKCYAFIQLAYVLNSVLAANGVAKLWPNMCFMVQTFYYQIVIMTWKYDVNLDNLISSFLSPSYICEILKRNFLKVYMIRVKKQTHHPQLSLTQRHKNSSLKKNLFFGIFQENTSSISSEWGWGDYKWTLYMWGRFYFIFLNNSSHNILHNWLHNLPPSDFLIWHLTVTLICSARHRDNHTQKISHYWK